MQPQPQLKAKLLDIPFATSGRDSERLACVMFVAQMKFQEWICGLSDKDHDRLVKELQTKPIDENNGMLLAAQKIADRSVFLAFVDRGGPRPPEGYEGRLTVILTDFAERGETVKVVDEEKFKVWIDGENQVVTIRSGNTSDFIEAVITSADSSIVCSSTGRITLTNGQVYINA